MSKKERRCKVLSVLKDAKMQKISNKFGRFSEAILLDENTPTNYFHFGYVSMEPGARVPLHYHTSIEEIHYILTGYGIFRDIEGKEQEVSEGSLIYCPPGKDGAHSLVNTGSVPLAFLFCVPSNVTPMEQVNLE